MPTGRSPNAHLAAALATAGLMALGFRRRPSPEAAAAGGDGGRADGAAALRPGAGARGRAAGAPSEIPAHGWWDILRRTAGQVSAHRLLAEAAGVTFFALLAIFPALTALVSLYGLVADPATISDHLAALAGVVPGGGTQIIEEQVRRVAAQGGGALGLAAVAGLAAALWSANAGAKALFDALNVVYDEREARGFLRRTAVSLAFTLGAILFALLAMAAVVALPVALNLVGLGPTAELLLRLLRWPLLLAAVAVFLACAYRYGPSRERARWRWVSWGGASAALAWLLFSAAFSWYVANFGRYNETYGSLGAAIGFMTWIWLSTAVVLVGAQLDAEMEAQTARDTTTGPERPLGARGATKADTVAPAPGGR
jgi:membrane protein